LPTNPPIAPQGQQGPEVILGIDPGSLFTGYGVIEVQDGYLALLAAGRLALDSDWPLTSRLVAIHERILELIKDHQPTAMAVEDLFTFKNPRSALKLAQARASAILAGALSGLPIFEYAPGLVKKTVAGSGRAEKGQVAWMVGSLLKLKEELPPDATDALAVAICHAGQAKLSAGAEGLATAAAGRARASSWRRLSSQDLADLGYRVERNL
jgi:crossover junction endodeoxyribonuclease RuvC